MTATKTNAEKVPDNSGQADSAATPEKELEQAIEELTTDSDMIEDDSAGVSADSEWSSLSNEELIEALTSATDQVNEMKDGFLRAKAEMENIRRRAQNEVIAARKFALEGFAQEILLVNDSLDQAAQVELDGGESAAVTNMKEGLTLTLKQLETVFGKFAITEVEAGLGVKFDPEKHQAISMVESNDVESNHIINVMQKGFALKDRLLRPAMVVVAS